MTAYTLHISPAALQELHDLDRPVCQRLIKKIRWLATNAATIRPDMLKGDLSGLFQLREGSYRIIYQRIEEKHIILIHAVGNRRDIYRKPR
jgi:mRNA interferase RelE/StbE